MTTKCDAPCAQCCDCWKSALTFGAKTLAADIPLLPPWGKKGSLRNNFAEAPPCACCATDEFSKRLPVLKGVSNCSTGKHAIILFGRPSFKRIKKAGGKRGEIPAGCAVVSGFHYKRANSSGFARLTPSGEYTVHKGREDIKGLDIKGYSYTVLHNGPLYPFRRRS